MRDGAVGLSTALIYPPGRFATTDELIALARVAGKYGGGYWTHLRNEANNIDARARRGVPHRPRGARAGQHLPPQDRRRDARAHAGGRRPRSIGARKTGLDVASQIYPYTATSTDLQSIVPAWALRAAICSSWRG